MFACSTLAALGVALVALAGTVLTMGALASPAPAGTETAPDALAGIPGNYLADFDCRGALRLEEAHAVGVAPRPTGGAEDLPRPHRRRTRRVGVYEAVFT